MLRILFWIMVAGVMAAIVIVIGATIAPQGSPFQDAFQEILDSVGAWFGQPFG